MRLEKGDKRLVAVCVERRLVQAGGAGTDFWCDLGQRVDAGRENIECPVLAAIWSAGGFGRLSRMMSAFHGLRVVWSFQRAITIGEVRRARGGEPERPW